MNLVNAEKAIEVPSVPYFTVIVASQPTPDKLAQVQRCAEMWTEGLSDLPLAPVVLPAIGKTGIAAAYNEALSNVFTPYVILAHNDAFPPAKIGPKIGVRLLNHFQTHGLHLAGFCGSSRFIGPRWQDASAHLYGAVVNVPPQPQPGQAFAACCWRRPARVVTGMRCLDGYCLVAKTDAVRSLGFDEGFKDFHFYDMDMSLMAHEAGMKTAVICDVNVFHQSSVGYSAPEWSQGTNKFLKAWAGSADPIIQGLSVSPHQIASSDPAMILRQLELDEEYMAPIVEAK
jgi:hypothetical protein